MKRCHRPTRTTNLKQVTSENIICTSCERVWYVLVWLDGFIMKQKNLLSLYSRITAGWDIVTSQHLTMKSCLSFNSNFMQHLAYMLSSEWWIVWHSPSFNFVFMFHLRLKSMSMCLHVFERSVPHWNGTKTNIPNTEIWDCIHFANIMIRSINPSGNYQPKLFLFRHFAPPKCFKGLQLALLLGHHGRWIAPFIVGRRHCLVATWAF